MRTLLFAAIGCLGLLLSTPALAQTPPATQPAATQPTATTPAATGPSVTAPTPTDATKATTAAPAAPEKPTLPNIYFVYAIIVAIFVLAVVAMLMVRASIAGSKFSLGEALSEEVEVTNTDPATGAIIPAAGPPVMITKMAGSTSRVIALMGSVVLLVLYVGFGAFVLFYYATDQGAPKGTDDIIHFMVAGLTLFAPYAVNKFASLFENLAPKH